MKAEAPEDLLTALDVAVQSGDQGLACMVAEKYLEAGHEPRDLQGLLRRVAVTADGAMHAEKYFWTAFEEFGRARAGHGRDQLVALARVSASEAGHVAPGVQEAARLLNG